MISAQRKQFIKNPIFVSYTSLSDFLKCPRSYFLKNLYRSPITGNRIQLASPYLSLGSTVHDAIKWHIEMEGQVTYEQMEAKFRNLWLKYTGKRGGFSTKEDEASFGKRGLLMLENFFKNAKSLEDKHHNIDFPKYPLLDNVILIGNFDFIGERSEGTLHVIDFKTGANDEKDPIQLYIYAILAEANLEKPVSAASFWYLDREDKPREIVLDPLEPKLEWLKEKATELKQALDEGMWVCIKGFNSKSMNGSLNDSPDEELCRDCRDYQAIVDGKAEFQFTDYRYKKDVYYLDR